MPQEEGMLLPLASDEVDTHESIEGRSDLGSKNLLIITNLTDGQAEA